MNTPLRHRLPRRLTVRLLAPLLALLVFALPAAGVRAAATWTATGSMTTARYGHTATLLPSGKVLVAGGNNFDVGLLSSAELYDPATGAWTATGSMAAARYNHTATLLPSGKVLVAGGSNGASLTSAELYDPAMGTWATSASMNMSTARASHTATLLPSGKVLVAGGSNGASLTSAELYDPATGTWTTSASMNMSTARASHTATLLPSGKVLVAGGVGRNYLASAELYDPAAGTSGTWTATGSMTAARAYHTATLLPSGKVLVTGGHNASFLASAELYDPAAGTWATSASMSMSTARSDHTATLLPSGKLLVTGGQNGSYLASAELYDPAAGTWAAASSLGTARTFHTATLLTSGKLLVAGGYANTGSYLTTAELYDPATDTWTAASSMSTARAFHTATLLPSEKLLVAGGYNSTSISLASAELYTPAGTAPTITVQPANQSVTTPATATFSATGASHGGTGLVSQWQQSTDNGTTWSNTGSQGTGASASYTTPATTSAMNGYQFRVVFTDSAGSVTSSAATLTVTSAPTIATQPANQSVTAPATATFSAGGTSHGGSGLTSQWQQSTDSGSTWTNAGSQGTGASASYTTPATTTAMNGYQFRVVFTDSVGSVNSSAATLTVGCGVGTKADITSPTGGSISSTNPTFQWGGGACVTNYVLWVGSSPSQYDYFSSGLLPGTTTSVTVSPGIPLDGRTIYVRLWSNLPGGYQWVDHSYVMDTCQNPSKADITSPTGISITTGTPTFQWGGGSCVTQYSFYVGSNPGWDDLYSAGSLASTTTSVTVSPAIPLDGRTIYVRLRSSLPGGDQAANHSYIMGACQNGAKADITSPSGGSVTTGTPSFQWGGGACITEYYFYVGSSPGQNDYYNSGQLPSSFTSATVSPAIPVDGRTIYVRLWSLVNGQYQAVDHTYLMGACNNPAKADITSPTGGSITSGTPTFTWGGGACITQYYFYVGSSAGQNDLFSAGPLPSTSTSATVSPGIPVDGRTVYVRLWSLVNGTYQAADHSYLMGACNNPAKADITSPAGGSITTGTPTFQWGGGSCVTQYYFYIGSSAGQNDLYSAGPLASTTTAQTVSPAIPVDGRTIYVRLWSLVNGQYQPVDHSYLMGACNNPSKADITSPTGGSITSGTPTFQWGGGSCVTQYYLYVGNSFGQNDLYSAGPLASTTTSATVSPAIPVDGRTIYVRLWSLVNGQYQAVDHSYLMGACQNPSKADISSPAGSTLHGASQTFTWSGGACVTQYYLYIGSSFGQADLYSSGPLAGTVTSQAVTLPANNSTVYVRLWSLVNGQYQAVDHSYVSAP